MVFSRKIYSAILATIAIFLTTSGMVPLFGQTNLETFGQNRIQYKKFDWRVYETKHFKVHHYDRAGRHLAKYIAEQLENDVEVIERKLGGDFPTRINVMVYNSYDEYRQTNVGRKYDSQLQNTSAGTVNIVGDKLLVYFNGKHNDIRRQTRLGMARVLMERMMFGESFREMVRNAVLMNLPSWTVDGFIAYTIDGWTTNDNTAWKNLAEDPEAEFFPLSEQHPELAGKAFWKYISDQYGQGNMKTLLYNMQLKGSLNQGVKMSLGQNVKEAYEAVMDFYRKTYLVDNSTRPLPGKETALHEIDVPADEQTIIRNIRVAPKGNDVAYVQWKNGEFKVMLQRTRGQKDLSTLLEGGRLDYNEPPDPNYPLLAWSNNGYKLAILFKKGKQTRLRIYNSLKAEVQNYVIPPTRFDRVLGMTFLEEDTKLLFSAIKRSQTDLYEFTIRGSRMKNITDDPWDDVQPWFVSGGSRKGVLFLSNRPEPNLDVPLAVNELPTGPMNVFFYNTTTGRRELLQMSNVTTGDVSQPIQYGSDNYAFLHDSNGIRNKYVVLMGRDSRNMDSAYAVPITNYPYNILSHQYNPSSNQVADVVRVGDKFKIYWNDLKIPGENAEIKELQPTSLLRSERLKKDNLSTTAAQPISATETKQSAPVLKSGNVFQTEFEDAGDAENAAPAAAGTEASEASETGEDAELAAIDTEADTAGVDSTFYKMRAKPYKLSFKPDFFTVRVDNSVLFNRYQSVAQNGGAYANPSLGGMITVSLDDKMENHRFTGGIRLPINFSGTSYFLQYENFTNRLDWGLLFLRTESFHNYLVDYRDAQTGVTLFQNEQLGKTITSLVQGSVTYPLDRIRSVRAHLGLREDKLNFKAQDTFSLSFEPADRRQYWALSRVEYVFDNTINPAVNIYNGFRYKVFTEYLYRLNNPNGGFYNVGMDLRYYKKIYKNFIWAIRGAAAHSAGNQKIVYYMGGVDNWINSQYSDFVPLRPTENYAFQALANNMRGYKQNARNGNTYGLINMEFRLPVVATFARRPIQSSLLKDLQLVTFADAGSAWSGFLPNAEKLRNDRYFPTANDPHNNNGMVTVQILDETGGLCFGYGVGLRTMLFGYFLRVDAATNVEGDPLIWHISLGTDF